MRAGSSTVGDGLTFSVAKHAKPYDVFVFHVGAQSLVGRKAPARIAARPDAPRRKGCLVEPAMIFGLLTGVETRAERYVVGYRPLPRAAIDAAFRAADASCDLVYPLRRLAGGRETAQPPAYWDARAADPDTLDAAEEVLRDVVCEALAGHVAPGAVIYDPACSSGAFLSHLARRFPGVRTLGQDRSPAMVAVARNRVHQVTVGDSVALACAPGTVDVVVCRHLNLDVVTSREARALFLAAASALRPGGLIVVVGHTPILVRSRWMEAQGFEILTRCGFTPGRHAVMQLYMMRRRVAPAHTGQERP
jgi:isonocardicin synthase